jgi:hypothetical protein
MGLAQFMPDTASRYGIANPFDPDQAIDGMGRMLRDLSRQYQGDTSKMLVGYNWGSGHFSGVNNDLSRIPLETQKYIQRITGSTPDPHFAALALNQDPVEAAIKQYYGKGMTNKPGEANRVIQSFWHNGMLPGDDGLKRYLAQKFGVVPGGVSPNGMPLGPAYRTSYGKAYGKTPSPFVDPEVVRKLAGMGWRRVSDDIRPLDPLFEYIREPNVLDMTPSYDPTQVPNQVVTALSMSFQNRFVLMPVTGWPYPTIQHMGAFDSDIRVGIALLADDEHFPIFRELNRMSHIMDTRSINLRPSIYNGRDVFAITKIACENRILNGIGIDYAVLTDLQAVRDPESPELIRLELGLTENGMIDEELFGHFSNSDNIWKSTLFAWLLDKNNWISDTGLSPFASKILELWQSEESAFAENKKKIDDAIAAKDPASSDLIGNIRTALTKSSIGRVLGNEVITNSFGVKYQFVPMKVGPAATPDQGRYRTFLTKASEDYCKKVVEFPVPVDAVELETKSPFQWASMVFKNMFGDVQLDDPNYYTGVAERYLDGRYGAAILDAITKLKATPPINLSKRIADGAPPEDTTLNATNVQAMLNWLNVWNIAHRDWYQNAIIIPMLNSLAHDFPNTFRDMQIEIAKDEDRKPGCYRDLGIANDIRRNPYEWVDVQLGPQIRDAMTQLANDAQVYASGIIAYARDVVPEYEVGAANKAEWNATLANLHKDNPKIAQTPQSLKDNFAKAVDAAYLAAPQSINDTLAAVKRISPVQFTVRRAFPTFKLYFVEEENGGTIKTFDEFYSYNAVLDWNLIEQTNQGSTLLITLSNIFNHLDALVLNETLNMRGINKLGLEAIKRGEQPMRNNKGTGGAMTDVGLDGTAQSLQNIALKPGTKIVLKAGYDNDPAKLDTIFTGQVTEIQTGDIMTIIAQGWESELFGTWDAEVNYPFNFWWLKPYVSSAEEDPMMTTGSKQMMKAILRHPQCKHFGHYQIGEANPFDFSTWQYLENKVSKDNAKGYDPATDRSASNIKPAPTPFYDVFGIHYELEKTAADGRVLWDIVQQMRLQAPNQIAMVRPYGNGDATLYFGPPYGFYTTTDFTDNRGLFNYNAFNDLRFEAFAQLIRREEKALVNRIEWTVGNPYLEGLDNDVGKPESWVRSAYGWAAHKDAGITLKPVPMWALLQDPRIASMLFNSTADPQKYRNDYARIAKTSDTNTLLNHAIDLERDALLIAAGGFVGGANYAGDSKYRDKMLETNILKGPNSTDEAIRLFFDAINEARMIGIKDQSDYGNWNIFLGHKPIRAAYLNYFLGLIDSEVVRILQNMKDQAEKNDPALADKLRVLDFMVKDVRKWHVVTSKHHIIANNIEVNSDFANRVRFGSQTLIFDPGLEDVRTRDYGAEGGAKLKATSSCDGYICANLLAGELRKMYRGELILTGNPAIRPHDVLVILDEVRQIFGMVEVDKVVNSMTLETGYITIVTPALMVEVGDMTMSHAYQAFYSALSRDVHSLQAHGGALGNQIAKAIAFAHSPTSLFNVNDMTRIAGADPDAPARDTSLSLMGVGGGIAAAGGATWLGAVWTGEITAGWAASSVAGAVAGEVIPTLVVGAGAVASAPLLPLFCVAAGATIAYGGFKYLSWVNNSIRDQFKQHPLTITPLVKRSLPWLGGVDGMAGRTVMGQWGENLVKGWRDYGKLVDIGAQMTNVAVDGITGQKTYENVVANKPTTGP